MSSITAIDSDQLLSIEASECRSPSDGNVLCENLQESRADPTDGRLAALVARIAELELEKVDFLANSALRDAELAEISLENKQTKTALALCRKELKDLRGKEALRLQAQQDVAAARAEVDSYKAALLEVKAVLKKERAERKAELASRDDTTGRASARVTKTQTTSSEKLVFWLGSAGKTTTSKAGSAAAPPIAKSSGTPKSTGSKTRALSEVTENSPSAVNTK